VADVVMPLMRGTVLADRAQAIQPSLKVLLVSGYPTSDIGPSGRPFPPSRSPSRPWRTRSATC
jgi:hypothetical protein